MARTRKGPRRPPPPTRPRIPMAALFRMFVVGAIAVGGAAYGLWRHVHTPRAPMLVPVPPPTEIPAPELVPVEH